MRIKKILLTSMIFIPLLVGCSSNDSFSLETESNELELGVNPVSFNVNISSESVLKDHSYSNIKWVINDESHCKLVNYTEVDLYNSSWTFEVNKTGLYTVQAYIDELYSTNSLTINVKKNSENVVANLTNVINQDGGLILGAKYDIGLNEYDKSYYSIEGADGVLKINDDGLLEVIGIDTSKLVLKKDNIVVLEKRFAVGHSILCTNIKKELIEKGVISSQSSKVTNSMLEQISKLNLSAELQNDLSCVKGLKYLINLEEIDISDNYLSDVSWLNSCLKLRKVNLSNNRIDSLSNLEENQNLEYIDASNNEINDISSIKFLTGVKYLDLSSNELKSINDISTAYSLESLFLNDNNLDKDKFYDRLSSLENLVELGVGNCNIKFTDIKSLGYINNLTYLDVSSANPSMESIRNMKSLETLILSDCELDSKNLNVLNDLKELRRLDLSNNSLNLSNVNDVFSNCVLDNLEYLNLGGNEFLEIPDLSNFKNITELDLTDSFNLQSINISNSNSIKSLILDNCCSLSSSTFNDEIAKLGLDKLSIQGGFSFFVKENYDYLMSLVESGNIELRFIDNVYTNKDTVHNYKSNVYFSYDELLQDFPLNENNECTLSEQNECKEIVLSLVNESATSKKTIINIDKSLFKLSIFGSEYKSYNIEFKVLDRKESSFTFDLYSFVCYGFNLDSSLITAASGSKVIINACKGNNLLKGADGVVYRLGETADKVDKAETYKASSAFDGYDLTMNVKDNSSISFIGGNGGDGPNYGSDGKGGSSGAWTGLNGGDGATAIKCHNIKMTGSNITIKGGNGGEGGDPNGGVTAEAPPASGNGGNGGHGVLYSGTYACKNSISINGGKGGKSGVNGRNFWGTEYVSIDGTDGSAIKKY